MRNGNATFTVAAIQMNSINDKKANLQKAEAFIILSAEQGAKIVALPEMFNFSGEISEKKENAESIPGQTINYLRELARKLDIYILCGSILEKSQNSQENNGRELFYNTSVFLNPRGSLIAIYRKIHLFGIVLADGSRREESRLVTPGDEVVQVQDSLASFGFSICYDIRFPELYRKMAKRGVEIIFIPSAFLLQTGKDHWEVLVRARAIENQIYVVAPDQIGEGLHGKASWGKSMIVDPWGTVLAKATEKEMVIFAEIDLSYQKEIRKSMPCLTNARDDLFNF